VANNSAHFQEGPRPNVMLHDANTRCPSRASVCIRLQVSVLIADGFGGSTEPCCVDEGDLALSAIPHPISTMAIPFLLLEL